MKFNVLLIGSGPGGYVAAIMGAAAAAMGEVIHL